MLNKNIVKTTLLSSIFSTACAMIDISPVIFSVNEEHNSNIVTVSNPNEYRSYISMQAEAYTCPNKAFECEGKDQTPYEGIEDKVMFSMPKFVLNPGQLKKIHASWNGDLPDQPIHVVYYADDHSEESIQGTEQDLPDEKSGVSLDLKVKTRYVAHILVFKDGTKENKPIISSDDKNIILENTGSSILIAKIMQTSCPEGSDTCLHSTELETIQPHSTEKYKFDPSHIATVRYFYNNDWKNEVIDKT